MNDAVGALFVVVPTFQWVATRSAASTAGYTATSSIEPASLVLVGAFGQLPRLSPPIRQYPE